MFYFYAKRGGLTPQQRAENVSHEITTLGKRFNLHPDSVYIESTDIVTDVMYGDKVIVSFTDQDGLWESCTRDQLAAAKRTVIVEKLKVMKEEHGLLQLFKRIAYFVLVLVGQFLLFKLTNWLFRKLKVRILRLRNTRLKAFSIQNFELLDTQKQVRLLVFVANLFRYAFMLLQLLLTVPMLFAIFPQTKNLAYQLFFYIWDPVKSILYGILAYIPNLFTIFVICLAIKYLVRLFRYLAGEVQSERLKLNGFYPDWAMLTYHIIRFLLYAFMVAMIYPYLPGADSGVFLCPVRRLGRLAYRDFLPVRRLGRPTIGIFCPSDVSDGLPIGIFYPSDVSDGRLSGFLPHPTSRTARLSGFLPRPTSRTARLSGFLPRPTSRTARLSGFSTRLTSRTVRLSGFFVFRERVTCCASPCATPVPSCRSCVAPAYGAWRR